MLVFLAAALVVFFFLRGGDLGTIWSKANGPGSSSPGVAASVEQAEAEARASPGGRQRPRKLRQRDSSPEPNPSMASSLAADQLAPLTLELDADQADDDWLADPTSAPGPDDDEATLDIAGTVLDGSGVPLPGIRIEGRALAPGLTDPGTASTNDLGMFAFSSLQPGEYALSVPESDDYHGAGVQVRAGSATVEIYLQGKGEVAVHGLVHDEVDEPLDGVLVRLLGAGETRSAVDGSYRIAGPWRKAAQAPVIEFRHPDYLVKRQTLASPKAGSGTVEVRLDVRLQPRESSAILAGRLTGPAGESVANARVWLSSSSPPVHRQAVTDVAGEYLMEQLEPGGHFLLGVSPPEGYANWVSEPMAVVAGSNRRDIELDRDDRGSLFGAVIDPEGRPLPNFALWARSITPAGQTSMAIVTDASGQFWLPEVSAGIMQLETRSLPRLEARGIKVEAGRDNQVVVPLDWGEYWLFGEVVDEQGQPVAGATLSLQWGEQFPDLYSTSVRQVRSDLDGQFTFSNLGAEYYALVARADGHATTRVQYVPAGHGAGEVQVVLEPEKGRAPNSGGGK